MRVRVPISRILTSLILSILILLEPVFALASGITVGQPVMYSKIDPSIASINTIHQGAQNAPIIYLIQDAHTNASAQLHSAKAIEALIKHTSTKYVFMEAGSGDESIRFLRTDKNLQQLKQVGMEFLRKGMLQGAEYQNLINDKPFVIWGVEDEVLYSEAFAVYQSVAQDRDKALQDLNRMKSTLTALEGRLFSQTIKELEDSIDVFQSKQIGFDEHVLLIAKLLKRADIDPNQYRYFKQILDLKVDEGDIDFEMANQEFVHFVKELQSTGQIQTPDNTTKSFTLSEIAYWLQVLNDSSLSGKYPQLKKYLIYSKKINFIQAEGALKEIKLIENLLIQSLSSEIELTILTLKRRLARISDIIELRADPDTYQEVLKNYALHHPLHISASINRVLVDQNIFPEKSIFEEKNVDEALKSAMRFYQLTIHRDRQMLQRMTQKIQQENLRESILIAGGFHTLNIEQKLKNAGYSYVLITPVVTHETDLNRYEHLLLNQPKNVPSHQAYNEIRLAQQSHLMRRRIISQPEDMQWFVSRVRPDLLKSIQIKPMQLSAARLSAESTIQQLEEKRLGGERIVQQDLDVVNQALGEIIGSDLRFNDSVGEDLNLSLSIVDQWSRRQSDSSSRDHVVKGLMVLQAYYDQLGHRLRRAHKNHAYQVTLDILQLARKMDPVNTEIPTQIAHALFHMARHGESQEAFLDVVAESAQEGQRTSRATAVGLANARLEMVRSQYAQFEALYETTYEKMPGSSAPISSDSYRNSDYDMRLMAAEMLNRISEAINDLSQVTNAYTKAVGTNISQIPRAFGILAQLEAEKARIIRKLHTSRIDQSVSPDAKLQVLQHSARALKYAEQAISIAKKRTHVDEESDRHTQSVYGLIVRSMHRSIQLFKDEALNTSSAHQVNRNDRYQRSLDMVLTSLVAIDSAPYLSETDQRIINDIQQVTQRLKGRLRAYKDLQNRVPTLVVEALVSVDFSEDASLDPTTVLRSMLMEKVKSTPEADQIDNIDTFVSEALDKLNLKDEDIRLIEATRYAKTLPNLEPGVIAVDLVSVVEFAQLMGIVLNKNEIAQRLDVLIRKKVGIPYVDTEKLDLRDKKTKDQLGVTVEAYDLAVILKSTGYLYKDEELLGVQTQRLERLKPWVEEDFRDRLVQRQQRIQQQWKQFRDEAIALGASKKSLRDSQQERTSLTRIRSGKDGQGGYKADNEKLSRLISEAEQQIIPSIITEVEVINKMLSEVRSQNDRLGFALQKLKIKHLERIRNDLKNVSSVFDETYLDYEKAQNLIEEAEIVFGDALIPVENVARATDVKKQIEKVEILSEQILQYTDEDLAAIVSEMTTAFKEEFENLSYGDNFDGQIRALALKIDEQLARLTRLSDLIERFLRLSTSLPTFKTMFDVMRAIKIPGEDGDKTTVDRVQKLYDGAVQELERLSEIKVSLISMDEYEYVLTKIEQEDDSSFNKFRMETALLVIAKRRQVATEVESLMKVVYRIFEAYRTHIAPDYRGPEERLIAMSEYEIKVRENAQAYFDLVDVVTSKQGDIDLAGVFLSQTLVKFILEWRGLLVDEMDIFTNDAGLKFKQRMAEIKEDSNMLRPGKAYVAEIARVPFNTVLDNEGFPIRTQFTGFNSAGQLMSKEAQHFFNNSMIPSHDVQPAAYQKWRVFTGVKNFQVIDAVASIGSTIGTYFSTQYTTLPIPVTASHQMFSHSYPMTMKHLHFKNKFIENFKQNSDDFLVGGESAGFGIVDAAELRRRYDMISSFMANTWGLDRLPAINENIEPALMEMFAKAQAGARLTQATDEQRVLEIEALLDNWDLDRVSEDERIETLLALLHGGNTMFPLSIVPRQEEPAYFGRMSYSEGLSQLLIRAQAASKTELVQEVFQLIQRIEALLTDAGIPKILTQSDSLEFNFHEALTVDRYFFNPFLISFTGLPEHARGEDEGRFQKALSVLKYTGAKKEKAKQMFLSYLDVYQPTVEVDGKKLYALRVKHNDLLGTPKGGVRYVTASSLLNDSVFKERYDRLYKMGASQQALRYFTRRWVKQETQPLAIGMTIKTAAINSESKESWWTEIYRAIFGGTSQNRLLGGGKGAILLADVSEQRELLDIFDNTSEGYLKWYEATRAYAADLYRAGKIGPDIDVPAPDVGTPPGAMDVATDEVLKIEITKLQEQGVLEQWPASLQEIRSTFLALLAESPSVSPDNPTVLRYLSKIAVDLEDGRLLLDEPGKNALQPLIELRSVFTAKSVDPEFMSGSQDRVKSTGYGVVHVLDQVIRMSIKELREKFKKLHPDKPILLSIDNQPLQHMTAKVMGFGNVGYEAIRELIERGVKVQMISEGSNGIIRKEIGFTINDLERLTELRKRHRGEPFFKLMNNEDDEDLKIQGAFVMNGDDAEESFYNTHSNIFVLAAKENTITTRNVEKMNADIYIEGANGAISYVAYDVLENRGSIVIPDSLANAGGVIVSYFEILQNRVNHRWPSRKVITRLEKYLNQSISEINKYRVQYKTDWRTATDVRTIEMLLNASSGARLSNANEALNNGLDVFIQLLQDLIQEVTPAEAILLNRALSEVRTSYVAGDAIIEVVPQTIIDVDQLMSRSEEEFATYHSTEVSNRVRALRARAKDNTSFAHAIVAANTSRKITQDIFGGVQDVITFQTTFDHLKEMVKQLNLASKQFSIYLNAVEPDENGFLWSDATQRVILGHVLKIRRLASELYLGIENAEALWPEEQTLLTQLSAVLDHFQTSVTFLSNISEQMRSDLNRQLEADQFLPQSEDFRISQYVHFRFANVQDARTGLADDGYVAPQELSPDSPIIVSRNVPVNLTHLNRTITQLLLDQDIASTIGLQDETGEVGLAIAHQWKTNFERWLIRTASSGARLADLEEAQQDAREIHRYLSEVIDQSKDAYQVGEYELAAGLLLEAVERLNKEDYSSLLRNTITTGGWVVSIYDFNNISHALQIFLLKELEPSSEYSDKIEPSFRRIDLILEALERFASDENEPIAFSIHGDQEEDTKQFLYLPIDGYEQLFEMLELYIGSQDKRAFRLLATLWSVIDQAQLNGQIFNGEAIEDLLPADLPDEYALPKVAVGGAPQAGATLEDLTTDYMMELTKPFEEVMGEWNAQFTELDAQIPEALSTLRGQQVLEARSDILAAVVNPEAKTVFIYNANQNQWNNFDLVASATVAAIRVIGTSILVQHTDGSMEFIKQTGDAFLKKNPLPATDTPDPLRSIEIRGEVFYIPIVDSPRSFIQLFPTGRIDYHEDSGARLSELFGNPDSFTGMFSTDTTVKLEQFAQQLQTRVVNLADRVFVFLTDNGLIARLQINFASNVSAVSNGGVWALLGSGEPQLVVPFGAIQSVMGARLTEDHLDDLRLIQQVQSKVNAKLEPALAKMPNKNQPKVVGVDLSVLEGNGLSEQAVYEAILPLLAVEFRMRYLRSSRQTVFYVSGPDAWVERLEDVSNGTTEYLFHNNYVLPEALNADQVQRSNLIRPDAQTKNLHGVTIPVIAPSQIEDQVSLLPISAILDFAEAAAELVLSDGTIDAENFVALKQAYVILIGQNISDDDFRNVMTGKADPKKMTLYGIPALKNIPISRLIKTFTTAARMAAQSA